MVRRPAVAGQFYRGTAEALHREVSQYILDSPKEPVIGILSPHAGLMYSGHVAGAVYSRIEFPETFLMLGPNHTGMGEKVSLMAEGVWEIPTGSFEIDRVLAHRLYEESSWLVSKDVKAHLFEHSLEVQLPFIAYFSTDVKIVPIAIMQLSLEEALSLGDAIAEVLRKTEYPVTIIASSDMSHYVSDEVARRLDRDAIERILAIDPEGLYYTVQNKRISMCGWLPATVMLHAARGLGASRAELVKYATSAEVSGDYEHVVGYAGVIVK